MQDEIIQEKEIEEVPLHKHTGIDSLKVSSKDLEDSYKNQLTPAQKADLTDGGTTTLHSHAGAQLEYVSIAPSAQSRVTTASVWEDWDLSAIVPAGTKYVEVLLGEDSNVHRVMGIRKNGTTISRWLTMIAYNQLSLTVEADANRIVERYCDSAAAGYFQIIGYWK